jgi:hypothetical protein
MITLQTDRKLNIISPNTNKALAEVLKSASPKELEVINRGKDLKSIINSLLKESTKNSASDKTMLELVKNNPTLKNLGSASQDIKNLLKMLKSDKNLQTIEKSIQKFIPDIKDIKNLNVKSTLENSGVFLESKLKNIQVPQAKVNALLEELSNILQKSKLPNSKQLNTQIKEFLSTTTFTNESPKTLENLAKNIQSILNSLKSQLKNQNPIDSQNFASKLNKLEHIIEPRNLQNDNFKLSTLKERVHALIKPLESSFIKESKGFIDALNKIFNTLKSLEESPATTKAVLEQLVDKKIPTDIKDIIQNIKNYIKESDSLFSKPTKLILDELSMLKTSDKLSQEKNIKELISNDFKSVLHKVGDEISKSTIPNQNEILKQIDKLSLQIDYHQLLSHLSNSSSLYIPFSWDEMQEGEIAIKHTKDDKFYCDIELKLKEYGELNLRLTLYDKNQLNLHINSDNEKFKDIIKESIPKLRRALIDMEITPREIRFFNKTKPTSVAYNDTSEDLNMGFEIKV